jgi:UDP-N-acetylglucosamine 2-epimerase
VTVHRAANTDAPERLLHIVQALNAVPEKIVFPVHPRTRKALSGLDVCVEDHIRLIEPVGYLDMVILEENARLIATDSGGVQREAYFLGIPCLTLRDETEWAETVELGWNLLVGTDPDQVTDAWFSFAPPAAHPPIFGDGTAGQRIVSIVESQDLAFEIARTQAAETTVRPPFVEG